MRDEIRRVLVDKGTVVHPVVSQELQEIHGCYQRGNQFMAALGGQTQQLYYVVNAILQTFPDDSALLEFYQKAAEDPKQEAIKNPKHPRELCMENFWIPFMVTYIKELKCEYL